MDAENHNEGIFLLSTDGALYQLMDDASVIEVHHNTNADIHGIGFGIRPDLPSPSSDPKLSHSTREADVVGHDYHLTGGGYHSDWRKGRVFSYEWGCWGEWWHYHPYGTALAIIRYEDGSVSQLGRS